jgi:hypothetical protein
MTVFGCGIASLGLLRGGLWLFYAICVVIGIVGNGEAHLAYSRSISTWFQRRLGTALAFVRVGAGSGAMILLVVAQAVVSRSGWSDAASPSATPVEHTGLTFRQGLGAYALRIIVAVLFVSSISMNGAITHLSALLTDRGISARDSALCASVLGGSSVLGRSGMGSLLD